VSYPERTIAQFLPNLRKISDWAKNTKKSPKRKSLISPCSSRFNQINFYGSFNSYHSTNQRKKNEQNWTQVNETKKQKKIVPKITEKEKRQIWRGNKWSTNLILWLAQEVRLRATPSLIKDKMTKSSRTRVTPL
jgi:hypothetical protein